MKLRQLESAVHPVISVVMCLKSLEAYEPARFISSLVGFCPPFCLNVFQFDKSSFLVGRFEFYVYVLHFGFSFGMFGLGLFVRVIDASTSTLVLVLRLSFILYWVWLHNPFDLMRTI